MTKLHESLVLLQAIEREQNISVKPMGQDSFYSHRMMVCIAVAVMIPIPQLTWWLQCCMVNKYIIKSNYCVNPSYFARIPALAGFMESCALVMQLTWFVTVFGWMVKSRLCEKRHACVALPRVFPFPLSVWEGEIHATTHAHTPALHTIHPNTAHWKAKKWLLGFEFHFKIWNEHYPNKTALSLRRQKYAACTEFRETKGPRAPGCVIPRHGRRPLCMYTLPCDTCVSTLLCIVGLKFGGEVE